MNGHGQSDGPVVPANPPKHDGVGALVDDMMDVAVGAVRDPSDEAVAFLADPMHCEGVALRGERCPGGLAAKCERQPGLP